MTTVDIEIKAGQELFERLGEMVPRENWAKTIETMLKNFDPTVEVRVIHEIPKNPYPRKMRSLPKRISRSFND